MTRLLATARCDVRLQARNGFYYATALVVAVWLLLISQVPRDALDIGWVLPAMIVGNLVLSTFYFVAGLMLLEKTEGTLQAQVVTPLRTGEYVGSKVLTLTVLALVENLVLVAALLGLGIAWLPLALGTALAAALFVLVGVVAVARYDSINGYLLPSVVYSALLELPLFAHFARWDHWLVYLHPMQAPLVIMRAAFESLAPWQLVYGVVYSAIIIGLAYVWSRREFNRHVVARAGAES